MRSSVSVHEHTCEGLLLSGEAYDTESFRELAAELRALASTPLDDSEACCVLLCRSLPTKGADWWRSPSTGRFNLMTGAGV